jgi:hypothetical protein
MEYVPKSTVHHCTDRCVDIRPGPFNAPKPRSQIQRLLWIVPHLYNFAMSALLRAFVSRVVTRVCGESFSIDSPGSVLCECTVFTK